ncbi:MAG TPA: BlaI/MecI/CopY family transcriptional regulator [Natronosporangium sp.]|nr:BlaI/MecI/CopY family transcriptional regulator [Natronosporangium sp.]
MAGLGELERAVMEVLWARDAPADPTDGATVREVADALADRKLAYTTVMTVLDRLAGKGMVVRHRDGRAWRYRPAAPREAYIAQLMLDALDLARPGGAPAGAGDRGAALVRFARSVSGAEAELLRRALEDQAREREG